ncbi:hypothetical protein Pelo_12774 [Pelomyxa schiedti]|nr:hypothetical protein Pelo_12774 [Pelomyxa schiedti]
MALMMSSHARCGRLSPASVLTGSENAALLRSMAQSWSHGWVVLQNTESVLVGVSLSTLGVVSWTKPCNMRGVVWVDSSRCFIATSTGAYLMNPVTDQRVDVPGYVFSIKYEFCGRWIIDYGRWMVWKLVPGGVCGPKTLRWIDDGSAGVVVDAGNLVGIRTGAVGRRKKKKSTVPRDEGWRFGRVVGDGFFDVFGRDRDGLTVLHLVDAERAYETGIMAPVDSVKITAPEHLGSGTQGRTYCFWGSKRVVIPRLKEVFLYDLNAGTVIHKESTSYSLLDNFFITYSKPDRTLQMEAWDFRGAGAATAPTLITIPYESETVCVGTAGDLIAIEDSSRTIVVEPSSGVIVFTLYRDMPHQLYSFLTPKAKTLRY